MYSHDDAGSSSNAHVFVFFFWPFLVLGGFQIFLGPKIHINEKSELKITWEINEAQGIFTHSQGIYLNLFALKCCFTKVPRLQEWSNAAFRHSSCVDLIHDLHVFWKIISASQQKCGIFFYCPHFPFCKGCLWRFLGKRNLDLDCRVSLVGFL